jgi:dTDP-4-dehydrorhamnose reductase
MADEYTATVFATRDELDITDYWRLISEFERLQPTVVINTASITDVDRCEDLSQLAEEVNHQGARNVARAAAQVGARVVHLSTDLVFDGALKRKYVEEDPAAPLSVYGWSKLAGERAVLEELPEATILRSSWFFGEGEGAFPENFLTMIAEGQPLGLVADRYGSPTSIPDLAEALKRLIPIPFQGLLHFTNLGEMTTRYDFILKAARRAGLDLSPLRPLSHLHWKGDRALRPLNSALDPSKFVKLTGWSPPTWEEALEAFLEARETRDSGS